MRYYCPHCRTVLTNVLEKPLRKPVERERIHLNGGAFLRHVAVAVAMGECHRHGVVRSEKIEEK